MGGPERVEKYMHSRGKLDVRQRIDRLFDPGTFREIGPLVGTLEDIPSDGFVCGYGRIDGRTVLAGAEDFTVLGGSIGAGNHRQALPGGRTGRPGGPPAGHHAGRRRPPAHRHRGQPLARRPPGLRRPERPGPHGVLGDGRLRGPRRAGRPAQRLRDHDVVRLHVHRGTAPGEGGHRRGRDQRGAGRRRRVYPHRRLGPQRGARRRGSHRHGPPLPVVFPPEGGPALAPGQRTRHRATGGGGAARHHPPQRPPPLRHAPGDRPHRGRRQLLRDPARLWPGHHHRLGPLRGPSHHDRGQ